MADQYIGEKQVSNIVGTGKNTPSGVPIMSVEYADGKKEIISSLMVKYVLADIPCNLSELRDKRVSPIVEKILETFRDWGLKLNELSYVSLLLNQSIDYNHHQAMRELWSKYMEKPLSTEDVDMLTLDKVLKQISEDNITISDVLKGNEK